MITVHFIKEGFNAGNGNNMFKFMLTILGGVSEIERELAVERIREGMAKAKRYGTRSGRPVGRALCRASDTVFSQLPSS